MAEFAPPSGPPPPQLPAGWKAIWNDQYQTWFYANTVTKETTWDKPTEPAYAPGEAPPPGGPPGYDHHNASGSGYPAEKTGGAFNSNNPYGQSSGPSYQQESDEAMARRLQEQEQHQRPSGTRGASDNYYGGNGPSPYGQQSQLPPREESGKRGLLSKISSKLSSSGGGGRPPQHYGGGGYGGGGYPQQGYGGGYPPQGYGHGPPMMGGPMYGGHGYGGHGAYGPPRRQGGGMGAGGGAALGLGAGMLGGMAIGGMMNDGDEQEAYQEGFEDGGDAGGDDGGGE